MGKNKHITNPKIIAAIKKVIVKHRGVAPPEAIVDAARPVTSPLHGQFTWDNTKAAERWRIEEARKLLQITVEYIKVGKENVPYRVFCSLSTDRGAGGYRVTAEVMSNKKMREQLLADAREDMRIFTRRYHELTELAPLFSVARKVFK